MRTTTHRVLDTDVELPMHVGRAVAGLTVHTADAEAIAATLPPDLVPVRLPGGRGVALLLVVDYVDNPLGRYHEVAVGLAARPAGRRGALAAAADVLRGRTGAWITHMPVSEAFTRAAGEQIWGYPKTLDDVRLDHDGPHATGTWHRDGELVLRMRMPTTGRLPAPPLPVSTFTAIDGTTMRTRLRARATGVGVRVGDVTVELGDHAAAGELAAFGLGAPVAAAWMTRMTMDFEPARPLHRSRP